MLIVIGNIFWRDLSNLSYDFFNFFVSDYFLLFIFWKYSLCSACLINDINRFIRKMPIINIFCRKFGCTMNCCNRILYVVMFFKPSFKPFKNIDRIKNAWLININFLKSSCERMIFFENHSIFLVSRRTNTFNSSV